MKLFTCYSPSGEKFELTRANYNDCINNFGFSVAPPSGVAAPAAEPEDDQQDDDTDEGADDAADATPADADDSEDEQEDAADDAEDGEDEQEDSAEDDQPETPAFDAEDKDSVKAYLRSKSIQFDGRASLADLVALANAPTA